MEAQAMATDSTSGDESGALVPVPVTVSVELPLGVPAPTLTLIVDDAPADTEAGLKLTLVPVGAPLALRLTDCADPLVTAVEIVEVPLAPWAMLTLLGLAPSEKSFAGGGVTVRVTEVVCVALVPVPVPMREYV